MTIKCEHCGSETDKVVDSRPTEFVGFVAVRRRRYCSACGERTITIEIPQRAVENSVRTAAKNAVMKIVDEIL